MTPGPDNDGRLVGRTRIEKSALLFFKGQLGVRSCKDCGHRGADVRPLFEQAKMGTGVG